MSAALQVKAQRPYGTLPKWTPEGWRTAEAPGDVSPNNPPDKSPGYRLGWACGHADAYRLEAYLPTAWQPKHIGDYVQIEPSPPPEPKTAIVRQIVSGIAAGWFLVEDRHCIAFLTSVAPAINQADALSDHANALTKHAKAMTNYGAQIVGFIELFERTTAQYRADLNKQSDARIQRIVDQRLDEFTKPAPPPKPQPQPGRDNAITHDQVSTRLWNIMVELSDEGRLPDFKPSSIRRIPQHEWLREPNFGRKSLAELVELCGNW